MARSLVIVESPAKAKTINKYLGRNYNVKASYGHVMDLPKKLKVIGDLQRAAVNAEAIYLAGDPDREGEAICAHLAEILSKPRKYIKVVAAAVAAEAEEANGNGDQPEASAKPAKKQEAETRSTPPKIYRVMFNE